jgi:hypothetical protein
MTEELPRFRPLMVFETLARHQVDYVLIGGLAAVLLDDVIVPVASLADVIRSKEAAGRERDRAALPTLRLLLERLDLGGPT